MQTAKNAAALVKETVANIGTSTKSGMEKTKAILQEKGERMTGSYAHDPIQKEMAIEKKDVRINQAEYEKQVAREQNATLRQATKATGTHSYSTTGVTGHPMGSHQMSALLDMGPECRLEMWWKGLLGLTLINAVLTGAGFLPISDNRSPPADLR